MSHDKTKYTRAEIETLELAPGAARQNLEGWVPDLANEQDLRAALEEAFDYRGDVTLTLKNGERIEAYIFNRDSGATLAGSRVHYFTAKDPERHQVSYAEIARLEFTGKDRAAGKGWEDWVKRHQEQKAAGQAKVGLFPEALD
jgi:hypothetical protein